MNGFNHYHNQFTPLKNICDLLSADCVKIKAQKIMDLRLAGINADDSDVRWVRLERAASIKQRQINRSFRLDVNDIFVSNLKRVAPFLFSSNENRASSEAMDERLQFFRYSYQNPKATRKEVNAILHKIVSRGTLPRYQNVQRMAEYLGVQMTDLLPKKYHEILQASNSEKHNPKRLKCK